MVRSNDFIHQYTVQPCPCSLFPRRLDSNLDLLKSSLHRAQQHSTRLHWLHEDLFIQAGIQPNPLMVANRAPVMSEIKKVNINLYNWTTSRLTLLNRTCERGVVKSP